MYTETGNSICNSCAVFFFSFIIMREYMFCKQFHVNLTTFLAKIVHQKCLYCWLENKQRENERTELIGISTG